LNEIKDGCKDLIQKKQKHGLAKSKEKREVLKSHTKLDIGQDKAPPTKIKNPPKPRHISATQQLVNLLTAQQNIQRQQTVQRQVQSVDKILTDNIKTPELPQQPQQPQLLLRTSPVVSAPISIPNVAPNIERQKNFRDLNTIQQGRLNLRNKVRTGEISAGDAYGILGNIKNNMIRKNIRGIVSAAPENTELLSTLDDIQSNIDNDLADYQSAIPRIADKSGAFRTLTSKLSNKEQNKKQNELLSDITTLGKKHKQEQLRSVFDRNTRLDLTKSESLKDVKSNPLAFKRDISAKELDTNEEVKRAIRDRDKYLQQIKDKGDKVRQLTEEDIQKTIEAAYTEVEDKNEEPAMELDKPFMLKKERTQGVVERDSPAPEKKPVKNPRGPRLKKEEEEVAMEEDPVDKSKLPFTKLRTIETLPAQKGDTAFYNKNYKGVLQQLEKSKLKELEGDENLGGPAHGGFLGGSVLSTKAYDNEEKPYRQTLKKNILNHIYNHQEEKYMDLYLTTEDPISKQYYKNMGIAVGKHFLKERSEYDESLYQKGIARLKGERPPKGQMLKRGNLADFQEQYKKLGLDQEGFNKRFNASEEDSEEWDDEAEDIKKRKKE